MIYCKKCQRKVVMDAFSEGICEVCGDDITCAHSPSDKVCYNCASDFDLCKSCGKTLKTEL